jgi:hypothetical protein
MASDASLLISPMPWEMREVQHFDEVVASILPVPCQHAIRDCSVRIFATRLNLAWHLPETAPLFDKATARIGALVVSVAHDFETHIAACRA